MDGLAAEGMACAFGPKGKTEGWQPCDRGHIGSSLKALARQEQIAWQDADAANFDLWEAGRLSASQKRTLVTHWFGEAVVISPSSPPEFPASSPSCLLRGSLDFWLLRMGLEHNNTIRRERSTVVRMRHFVRRVRT